MSVFNNPWQPSGRSTWPDSGNGVEHGYMKLSRKQKMIRIRQTIYEDPGNPFQDELDAERAARGEAVPNCDKPLPSEPEDVSPTGRSFFELDISDDPIRNAPELADGEVRSRSLRGPLPVEPSEVSPISRRFQFDSAAENQENTLRASGRPEISRAASQKLRSSAEMAVRARDLHHRSMSVAAIPTLPPQTDEYVSPRRFWRRENSLPLMKEGPDETSEGPKSARDTKFYGFYEGLVEGYGKRQSRI